MYKKDFQTVNKGFRVFEEYYDEGRRRWKLLVCVYIEDLRHVITVLEACDGV